MPRRANPRLVKRHRSYTIDEAARTLRVAKGTIRNWIGDGLEVLKDQRPYLILGQDLIDHLTAKAPKKQRCLPHQCYCFTCRQPRDPAFGEVEYHPVNETGGNLRALCIDCTTTMHKRVSISQLPAIKQEVTIHFRKTCDT